MDKTDNKKQKKKIELPTFFIILMLFFGAIGLIAVLQVNKRVKHCTNEVTGYVDREGHGGNGDMSLTVEGKYVDVGTDGQDWVAISIITDDIFRREWIYADRSYGSVGDKLIIHYNPENPDEYYIGDYTYLKGYGVALVTLVISGINLILTVIFIITDNIPKEENEEEKERKREEKKKRSAERKRNAEDKIEKGVIISLIIGGVLIASSLVITYIDIHTDRPIPFNNYSDTFDGKVYSAVAEKPLEISTLADYGKYWDLKVGNDHILAVHLNEKEINGADGPIKLCGKLCRVSVRDEKKREIIKVYYQNLGYFDTLKNEEFAYYCLDCSEISLWEELKHKHMIGFAFGLVFVLVSLYGSGALFRLIKFFKPR